MSLSHREKVYRDAIAACHEWPDSGGVVTQDDPFIYVKIRDPYGGLLVEELIQKHGFQLSYRTKGSDCIILFN